MLVELTELTLPILGRLASIDVVLLGWLLVTLYTGPIGLGLYILSCKEPRPYTHEEFVTPLWKQAMGSTIHCVAGDATGIILAATITALLGFPMWLDLIVEYAAGFAFGLFIFQSLFMKDMMGGSYLKALRMSVLPEWLSMNMVMAGMIPVMVVGMMGRDMRAMDPSQLIYWGVMSAGVIVGFATAYPVNWWLVAKGLKHGMGTDRARGKGGHSQEAERERLRTLAGQDAQRANGRAVPEPQMAPAGHAGHGNGR